MRIPRSIRLALVVGTAALLLAACGGGGGHGPPATHASSARPSSPARLTILSPRNGQTIRGPSVHVRIALRHARVVRPTSQHITPTTGHLHVYLDNRIVSMNYGLSDTISDVKPGTHVLRVEFVASDHLPFDPRVVQSSVFSVTK